MGIGLKLHRFRVITPLVLVLTLFVFGAVALAYLGTGNKPVQHVLNATSSQESKPASGVTITAPATEDGSDPCTKNVSETTNSSGADATNTKTTSINCNLQSDNGNSSINVFNSTNQSATSGDSTGQSGSSTNTDSTNINIDL